MKNTDNKRKNSVKNNVKDIKKILFLLLIIILFLFVLLFINNFKYKNNLDILNAKIINLQKELIKKEKNIISNNVNDNLIIKNPAVKIPILSYHRTVTSDIKNKFFKDNAWVNDLDDVKKQLEYLYNNGWKTIDLDDFYCWYNKECNYEEKTFVITIDDGDSEAYYNLLPLFEKYNFKATLFSIGKEIPEITEELNEPKRLKLGYDKILELRNNKSLLQVESHTYNMHHKNGKKKAVEVLSYSELVEDFEKNKKYNFKYLAYPYGIYTKDMLKVTSNSDIKLAFKIRDNKYATRLDNKYEIARIEIDAFMKMDKFKKIFEYAKGE